MSITLLYYTLVCNANSGGSGIVQYTYYDEGATEWRKGVRDAKFVYDKALTPLGFGVGAIENIDWEEVNYIVKP